MESSELCVPIYLNQQIVFDLLAIVDDGFSQLSIIKTAEIDSESKKTGVGGSIGVSNVFGLFGISLGGEKGKEKSVAGQKEVSTQKVHTPTSLFAKLRVILTEQNLIRDIEASTEEEVKTVMSELEAGQFVEFRAILRKNPLVETIEWFKQIMQIAVLFPEADGGAQSSGKQGKVARRQDSNQLLTKQMEGILSALTQFDSIEIIGEMLNLKGVKAVLSAKLDYFSDRNASEIVDGEFRVLGKIVRVIRPGSEEGINLLRKTSFGVLSTSLLGQIGDSLQGAEEAGVKLPEFVTEVKGPALQVIPISIFT